MGNTDTSKCDMNPDDIVAMILGYVYLKKGKLYTKEYTKIMDCKNGVKLNEA